MDFIKSYGRAEQQLRQLARATSHGDGGAVAYGCRPPPNTLLQCVCGHRATKPPNNIRYGMMDPGPGVAATHDGRCATAAATSTSTKFNMPWLTQRVRFLAIDRYVYMYSCNI